MPLNIPKTLPAVDLLKKENIFVMDRRTFVLCALPY